MIKLHNRNPTPKRGTAPDPNPKRERGTATLWSDTHLRLLAGIGRLLVEISRSVSEGMTHYHYWTRHKNPSLTLRVGIAAACRTLDEIRADIIAVEKEAEGLLDQLLHGGVA